MTKCNCGRGSKSVTSKTPHKKVPRKKVPAKKGGGGKKTAKKTVHDSKKAGNRAAKLKAYKKATGNGPKGCRC